MPDPFSAACAGGRLRRTSTSTSLGRHVISSRDEICNVAPSGAEVVPLGEVHYEGVRFAPGGMGETRALSLICGARRGSDPSAAGFDLSFKSAKSVADSIDEETGDSFTRSKSTNAFNVEANVASRLLRSQNTVKNLLSFQTAQTKLRQSEKTRREERIDFIEHVRRVRAQLKQMSACRPPVCTRSSSLARTLYKRPARLPLLLPGSTAGPF